MVALPVVTCASPQPPWVLPEWGVWPPDAFLKLSGFLFLQKQNIFSLLLLQRRITDLLSESMLGAVRPDCFRKTLSALGVACEISSHGTCILSHAFWNLWTSFLSRFLEGADLWTRAASYVRNTSEWGGSVYFTAAALTFLKIEINFVPQFNIQTPHTDCKQNFFKYYLFLLCGMYSDHCYSILFIWKGITGC